MLHRIKSIFASPKVRSILGVITGAVLLFVSFATLLMLSWNWLPFVTPIGFWQSCLSLLALFILTVIIMSLINTVNSMFVVISTIIFILRTKNIRKEQGQERVHLNNIFSRFLNIKDNLE